MGFLDNVKDVLKGAVSTRASKDGEAAGAARKDDVAASSDTTTTDDSVTLAPVPRTIPAETTGPDPSAFEPTTAPVVPVEPVTPAPAPLETAEEKFETYTVKSGDTLSEICAREGVSYPEIARINNIDNPDLIFPGQVFRIPKEN